jgi:hypothetical protein
MEGLPGGDAANRMNLNGKMIATGKLWIEGHIQGV